MFVRRLFETYSQNSLTDFIFDFHLFTFSAQSLFGVSTKVEERSNEVAHFSDCGGGTQHDSSRCQSIFVEKPIGNLCLLRHLDSLNWLSQLTFSPFRLVGRFFSVREMGKERLFCPPPFCSFKNALPPQPTLKVV